MKKFTKLFSSILAFALVLSLLAPFSNAHADEFEPFKQNHQSESTLQLKAAIAEQLRVASNGPVLHESLQNLSDDQEVAVIVHLSEKPVVLEQGILKSKGKKFSNARANEVRANVKAQQNKVKKQLAVKNVTMKQGYTFDTVLNGFAATVKAKDLEALLQVEGVTLVEPDATVYASEEYTSTSSELYKEAEMEAFMSTSTSFLGIEELWAEGLEGQGIKVAVLDTGIDADHPDFAGIYKGGKNFVVHSSTYAFERADDDGSETSPLERPANVPEFNDRGSSFYTTHGTHVAGTIAAIGANEYGIKGIAPKVDLYSYRVLGAYGSGATSSIIKAIETAVIEEMDVINLSLGGGANTETDASSFALNNAMIAGTIAVVATGNSGPSRGTMGTPSTSRLAIAVGNTTNPEATYNGEVNVSVGNFNLTKQLPLMATTFGQSLSSQLQGEYELVAIPGIGSVEDFEGIDVAGKVALIVRGEIAFVDKIANAKANGAAATIIHNFTGGTNAPNISGTLLGDSFDFIPTFDMSVTDGEAIRVALENGAGIIRFGNFSVMQTAGDDVNASSSRGPSTPNFDIKPDVTAPGTNIMSTIPMYKNHFPDADYTKAFARKTGTSMATPHIAGIVALMKQANPEWTPFDVKVALSNTAEILDTTKYDVFAQGAGRVNAYAAVHPEVLAYAIDKAVLDSTGAIVENIKGTVTFGPQPLKNGNISVTKQVLVKDLKGNGGDFNVSVDVTKSFADANVTVDQSTFTLNGQQLLNITLTASQTSAPAGSEILGYIHISNSETNLSLPFAADFGGVEPIQLKDYRISTTDLSFNGDGINDSALLSFTLTGDVGTNYIEIWDILNPTGGAYGDGYIGYLHAGSSLGKGSYSLNVGGQYRPWSGEPATIIPDGLYTIDFTAASATGNIGGYVGPIVVKSTKPSITGSEATNVVTGQVSDKYIEYNEALKPYGLSYEINTKLSASYIETVNGEQLAPVAIELQENGSFMFEVSPEATAAKVIVKDAAGNIGEAIIFEREVAPVVTLQVSETEVETRIGKEVRLKVVEVSSLSGKVTERDVTGNATYTVANDKIASVKAGVVKGKGQGTTTITITFGEHLATVTVHVAKPGNGNGNNNGNGNGNNGNGKGNQ